MKNYRLAVDENGSPFVLNSKGSIDLCHTLFISEMHIGK